MKKNLAVFPAVMLGLSALAYAQGAPTKVATIHIQNAIMSTKDGQKALQEMQARFNPKKAELDRKQSEIAALQDQLNKGKATMSDQAKEKMAGDIQVGQKTLQRDGEDFEAEVQQEESKLMNDLGQKMMDVVIKYATKNGYAMVIDVSSQQTPVLWRDESIDITAEMVKLYDQAHPAGASTAAKPPAAAPKPAATPPAPASKPPAPPAAPTQKKQ